MIDRPPDLGHGRAAPGWFLYVVGDFLAQHGMELLSAAAIGVGIAYHMVLIRNARESHRLDLEDRERRRRFPWGGNPFSQN